MDCAYNRRFALVAKSTGLCIICVLNMARAVDSAGESLLAAVCAHNRLWTLWTIDPLYAHCAHTRCAQFLDIELFPNIGNLLAHDIVELHGLFDLFYGMDGGCMVFAPKFGGDFGEAQVQLAAQ